ncbi:hypothetical protein PUNSTDRAFT_67118 [Punctularia strigosozonata HHB-11173 SS5]|uniref:uncharacterized protein n=1 Tax=Punctularia strigosozonata (strain HHB-11173) TaxID=741275 RepID=UPI0004417566|nr:uncharacterized protein PUNSTDRAFT_67118 [Punctularia strigosozonata HHB-11173 SS5]EIN09997.1 hypothetical protein PUNSTDRAFT_67118 [Punctularia strigosozonata HHB-11173 SS5]
MDSELEEQTQGLLNPSPDSLASVKVFPLIPHLKKDIISNIDSALTWEQLTASDINFAIIRPLVFKYAQLKNPATIYACLVVRSHFLALASEDIAYTGLMMSRANACEILAIKLVATFAPSVYSSTSQVQLVAVLTTSWSPLQGAPPHVLAQIKADLGISNDNGHVDDYGFPHHDIIADPECALELAIATKSKNFLSSPVVQAVVNDIYTGRVVFSMTAHKSVLADNYKPRAIEIYDSRSAPFLDHYRLRVPRYGAILEFLNFALLLVTFVLCLTNRNMEHMQISEIVFIVIAIAFALEEYTASKEHGWNVYIANMWNVFDTGFVLIFLAYFGFRLDGLLRGYPPSSELSFDILACGACILFPRLAFFAIKNNLVVIALRGMMTEFLFFMGIAAICFSGLLYTLWTLVVFAGSERWSMKGIMWLMVQIWFGNTYLSFAQAASFHPLFGPILMTGFAALSNTLLLTILISILSNTFARIDANAEQEYMFQFAITTIEGVKSDALFSYQPPFNLLAFIILWPASFVMSPRTLHSWNVFLIKLTSFPTLVVIGVYERYLRSGQALRKASEDIAKSLPRSLKNLPILDAIMGSDASDLYDAIFELNVDADPALFSDDDEHGAADEAPALRSIASVESLRLRRMRSEVSTQSAAPRIQTPSKTRSPRRAAASVSPTGSPRRRRPPPIAPSVSAEVRGRDGQPSPLSRLFGGRPMSPVAGAQLENTARRLEAMLEDVKDLPVNKLKEEMKELQERQARIENLLLMLTRGMRHDTGQHSAIRHDTK